MNIAVSGLTYQPLTRNQAHTEGTRQSGQSRRSAFRASMMTAKPWITDERRPRSSQMMRAPEPVGAKSIEITGHDTGDAGRRGRGSGSDGSLTRVTVLPEVGGRGQAIRIGSIALRQGWCILVASPGEICLVPCLAPADERGSRPSRPAR
jgi:hypothetical protein